MKNTVFQNLSTNSEISDFFDMRNGLFYEYRAKLGETGFFGKMAKINSKNEKIYNLPLTSHISVQYKIW